MVKGLHIDDGGTGGLPVVFLHSFAGSASHWKAQLDHFRRSRRAIAFDARGHGQSDAPKNGDYAVQSMSADLAAVVDGLGLDRFVLVGHSMGGAAAIDYAGAHPERVAGLILIGTPGKSSPEMASQIMSSMEKDYEKVAGSYWDKLLANAKPNVESQIRSDLKAVPKEPSLAIMRAIFDYDPTAALGAYKGPKLIVDISEDAPPGSLPTLAPDASRKIISGASHWPHMDKPEELNAILDAFLGAIR